MHPRHMHRYSDEQVALACHEALRGLQKIQGPYRTAEWDDMHPDLRQAAVYGVSVARRGETPSARDHHNRWVEFLLALGWEPGERDLVLRRHPNLVSWEKLSEDEQDKTRLFLSTVVSLTVRGA